jgi:hypothetical protein
VVREAFSAGAAKVVAAVIAEALILGGPMPAAGESASLPNDVQKRLVEYRRCEASFKSGLMPPRGASDEERTMYGRRVGIERVVVCLFPGRNAARVASGYALDLDFEKPGDFVDELLRDLPVKWLAPYLNLTAGHAKLCEGRPDTGQRQLTAARDSGHPLIRVAAEYLMAEPSAACVGRPF